MIRKLAEWITGHPRLIILVSVLLLIPSALGYLNTKTNYDILAFLPENVESVQGEHLLEEPFGAAATSMVIVEDMPAEYSNRLINRIKKVDHVSNAVWVSNLVGIQIPTMMMPEDLKNNFYSGNATMMIVQFDRPVSSEETMDAVDEIRSMMTETCYVAGMASMVADIKNLVLGELPAYTVTAVILTLIILLFSFESYVLPFLFLGCIGLAIVYNMGSNIILGQISYITKAIAAILQLGVTMDYSIFLYHRYEEELKRCPDRESAMTEAVVTAFTSLSGSSLTTIAGFMALCFMRFSIGRDMGLVMAKGVVLGIICVILILPCLILVFDGPIRKYRHRNLFPDFTEMNRRIVRHRGLYLLLFLILLVPAVYAQRHAGIYYRIDQSLPADLNSRLGNEKLKEEFDMATEHFIIIDGSLDNGTMTRLEQDLEALPGVKSVISYHKVLGNGIPDFFVPDNIRTIFRAEDYQLIMLTSDYSIATQEVKDQIDGISAVAKRYDPNCYITGESALYKDLEGISTNDFTVTNYLSIAMIVLIVMFVFRSLSIPLILILSIELAININEGIPYFTGKEVSFIAPTIISAIQLGATVDYAILITSRFREEIEAGKSRREAAVIAGAASDASVITSSVTLLCATLGVTLISSMKLIQEICLLLARGAMISAAVTIFILPSLLCIAEPVIRRTTLSWGRPKEQKKDPDEPGPASTQP